MRCGAHTASPGRASMLFMILACVAMADRPAAQTDAQKSLLNYWLTHAANYSVGGRADVLTYLDSPSFRKPMEDTPLANRSAHDLSVWFMDMVQSTNVIHSFEAHQLSYYRELGYIPNIWQLLVLGKTNYSKVQDSAETRVMKYKAFATPLKPTWAEACDRPQYLSLNIWRGANGQPFYGELHAVLHPEWTKKLIIAPVDTGGFTQDCILVTPNGTTSAQCNIWDHDGRPFGVWDEMWHMVKRHPDYYRYPLYHLFKHTLGVPYTDPWYFRHYYEADLMGTFLLPEGLSYIIANYTTQFGNRELVNWLKNLSRPLTWAGDFDTMVLDPVVNNTKGEYIVTKADSDMFQGFYTSKPKWDVLLKSLTPSLQLRLLRFGSCFSEKGFDYDGHDLGKVSDFKTSDQCCRYCDWRMDCQYWTFWEDKGICFVKASNAGRKVDPTKVSGRRSSCPVGFGRTYIAQNHNLQCIYW